MRKILFLPFISVIPALMFAISPGLEGASGIGRAVASFACASAPLPWTGLDPMPEHARTTAPAKHHEPVLHAVTLNIHSGMGQWKGLWSTRTAVQRRLDGIADTIVDSAPAPLDIVALNEVDFSAHRSGRIDQARYLADALERRIGVRYHVVYGQTRWRLFPGLAGAYGNALLVRHPTSNNRACLFDDVRACGMADAPLGMPELRAPGWLQRVVREGRGLIKVTLDFHGRPVDVIATHLEAVAMQEREAQASHLLRRFVDPGRTTIVLGDVNAVPTAMTHSRSFAAADRTHDILTSGSLADARVLHDSRLGRTDFRAWSTFPADAPTWPLDAAFGSLDLFPQDVRVMDAVDSDHRGFYVAYRLTRDPLLVKAQRSRHDTIRRRQLAQILACDVDSATETAKLNWLRDGTLFAGLSAQAITPQ